MTNGKEKISATFYKGFVGGVGWALGATVGFALVLVILSYVLRVLGGLPIIGEFFATIVDFTQKALETRKNLGQ